MDDTSMCLICTEHSRKIIMIQVERHKWCHHLLAIPSAIHHSIQQAFDSCQGNQTPPPHSLLALAQATTSVDKKLTMMNKTQLPFLMCAPDYWCLVSVKCEDGEGVRGKRTEERRRRRGVSHWLPSHPSATAGPEPSQTVDHCRLPRERS